jgi:hypothetical protein
VRAIPVQAPIWFKSAVRQTWAFGIASPAAVSVLRRSCLATLGFATPPHGDGWMLRVGDQDLVKPWRSVGASKSRSLLRQIHTDNQRPRNLEAVGSSEPVWTNLFIVVK